MEGEGASKKGMEGWAGDQEAKGKKRNREKKKRQKKGRMQPITQVGLKENENKKEVERWQCKGARKKTTMNGRKGNY